MKLKPRHSGLTLTEMTIVVAAVALLTALSMPAVRSFFYSMSTSSGTKALISASLASARAIAAKEQKYAGIRFQKAYDARGVLDAPQYMIFIVYDYDKTGLANGFRAVEGIQPIKLSDDVGVIDLSDVILNPDIDEPNLINATAFSIIFSPSGRLVTHDVQIRNRNGIPKPDNGNPLKTSMDDIFNSELNIINYKIGMFLQDDYPSALRKEPGRNSFIIYEKDKFKPAFLRGRAYRDYLYRLVPETIHINPYTGTIINEQ